MLLRNLCAVMALAWLVKVVAERGPVTHGLRRAARNPLLVSILLFVAASALSTLASVARYDSFAGSYLRSQGLYTTLCYILAGLAVAANLRSPAQVGRLVSVMIAASLPVAAYGIAQAYGLDPLEWNMDWKGRAASTQGNPVFLGALMCMVVPLTLVRLAESLHRVRDRGPWFTARGEEIRRLALASLPAVAQPMLLIAFVLVGAAESNVWWAAVPVLGVFLLLVLLAPSLPSGRATSAAAAAGYAVALAAQVGVLLLSQSRGPWLGLFAGCVVLALAGVVLHGRRPLRLVAVGAVVAIAGAVALLNLPHGPFEGTRVRQLTELFESRGGSGRVRVLVWKGALELAAERPVVNPAGDSLHGLRPLVGYGPETFRDLYARVYRPELGQLDPETRYAVPDRAHNALLDNLVSGGVLGVLAYLLVFHMFLALALERLGLVALTSRRRIRILIGVTGLAGVLAYLAVLAWRGPPPRHVRVPPGAAPALVLAFVAAGVAHFVETLFGFGTVSSLAYLWLGMGVVAAGASIRRDDAAAESPEATRALAWAAVYAAASAALVVVLTRWDPAADVGPSLLLVAGFVWLIGALAVWALASPSRATFGASARNARAAAAVAVAGVAAVGAVVLVNSASVAADVLYRNAVTLEAHGDRVGTTRAYQQALRLAPRNAFYHRRFGAALAAEAAISVRRPRERMVGNGIGAVVAAPAAELVGAGREQGFLAAEAVLTRALQLAPRAPESYAGLARLYRTWAMAADGEARLRLLARATSWYERALELFPRSYLLHLELGRAQSARGDHAQAVRALTRAIEVQPATELTEARELRGNAYLALRRYRSASVDYRKVLTVVARDRAGAWRIRRNLGLAYARLGNHVRARTELAAAKAKAPRTERAAIDALVRTLLPAAPHR